MSKRYTTGMLGKKFGRLTVTSAAEPRKSLSFWKCKCDCGNESEVRGTYLRNGHTSSCGCLEKENLTNIGKLRRTHGLSEHPLFKVWASMKKRCKNPKCKAYKNYGGRGIKVSKSWQKFSNFYADMGEGWKPGLTLERKDNNGDYKKSNCGWATRREQMNNTRCNRIVTVNGEQMTLMNACRKFGIRQGTASHRLDRDGWSEEDTFLTPVKKIRHAKSNL